jgi:hypothetical protein
LNGRFWTDVEDAYLLESYGTVPVEVIAAKLKRTVPAVYGRAGMNHLGRDRPPGAMSLNEFMEALGIGAHAMVVSWIEDGLLVGRRMSRYGRENRGWLIEEADAVAFLRANPWLVDRDKVNSALRQYLPERWVTFPEAFKRGAAHPFLLEAAALAGLIPDARRRGSKGTWWVRQNWSGSAS